MNKGKNNFCPKGCHKVEVDEDWAEKICEACHKEWIINEAVSHGIPRSVAEGKTKLSDHFSEDYINWKCGRGEK